jgi:uncharacterized membrane protein
MFNILFHIVKSTSMFNILFHIVLLLSYTPGLDKGLEKCQIIYIMCHIATKFATFSNGSYSVFSREPL